MSEEKDEKSALVPRRRFPEFRKVEAWKLEPLSSLAKRCTAKNAEGEHTRVLTNSAEFGVVDQRDYFDKDIANQGNLEGYYIVEKGDYVYNPCISTSAPVGPISKNNVGTGVMSPLYTVFRFDSSNNDFYAHYFKSTHWHHYMRQASSTGARHDRMSITNDDFMGLPLPASVPKEQQKIADCLSSLDDLIAAETQKLDALKTHKKGLMQQLFPREGETVPRLRFPEFRGAPPWKAKALNQISPSIFDGTHQTPTYTEAGVPFFSVENIVSGNRNKFISEEDHIAATRKNKPEIGDLLVTRIGIIGYSAVVHWEYDFSIYVTLAVVKSSPSFDSYFLHGYFQSSRYQTEILSRSLLNAVPCKINMDELRRTEVLLPEIDEQHKIADCLSSLDDLIIAHSQKITAFKTHKKGLMQQLFPVLDEVPA